jgi:formylglycine-generating enzyme
MKHLQTLRAGALAAFSLAGGALSALAITIDTVPVGNVGNANDTTGYGAVGYSYNIGKFEVTNAQYMAFLNAVAATDTFGLYNTNMSLDVGGGITRTGGSGSYSYALKSGYENKPVNYVSFWDATRFANWLNNGQGSGSTETGSYSLGGVTNPVNSSVTRNLGANWVVTSESEWYKAAYYDPTKNSGAGGYWLYATQSDTLGQNNPFTAGNGANYYDGDYTLWNGLNDGALSVGTYGNADSYYGTYDQNGNVFEWNDTIVSGGRGQRGGSWNDDRFPPQASFRSSGFTTGEFHLYGFRVASLAPIPEPSTYAAVLGSVALGGVMLRRRRAGGQR